MAAEVADDNSFAQHGAKLRHAVGLEGDGACISAIPSIRTLSARAAISPGTDSRAGAAAATNAPLTSIAGISSGHIEDGNAVKHDVLKGEEEADALAAVGSLGARASGTTV